MRDEKQTKLTTVPQKATDSYKQTKMFSRWKTFKETTNVPDESTRHYKRTRDIFKWKTTVKPIEVSKIYKMICLLPINSLKKKEEKSSKKIQALLNFCQDILISIKKLCVKIF